MELKRELQIANAVTCFTDYIPNYDDIENFEYEEIVHVVDDLKEDELREVCKKYNGYDRDRITELIVDEYFKQY